MKVNSSTIHLISAVTASFISSSCTNSPLPESTMVNEHTQLLCDEGNEAISLQLSKRDVKYLKFLNRLAKDIISEPAIARQFVRKPNEYAKMYGFKKTINLDEGLMKLILALGDDEINASINNEDIIETIEIMENKGLLDNFDSNQMILNLSDEEIRKIYHKIGINVDNEYVLKKRENAAVVAVALVYAVAGVASQVAVAYNVLAGINAVAAVNVLLYVEAWGASEASQSVINSNLPLKIWKLKGYNEKTFIATDKYVTQQSNFIMKLIKKHDKQIFKYIGERQLEQIVKCNIIENTK